MHIHIIGICGTFMGGLALIARELGYEVSGSDQNVYPPMSTQLAAQGIQLMEGYRAENLAIRPDCVVIGNALSRGNPEVEAVLNSAIPYQSGPQWLAEHVLQHKWVLAVAGTHGKTTTSSMLSWILERNDIACGFLIGGIPLNFGLSARLGDSNYFVIEADEYDSAFFDKRSKFVHYRPRTAILNNLEFDHADIFPDLEAIKKQFHHLVRTVPGNGLIIYPESDAAVQDVLDRGCWTALAKTSINANALWNALELKRDGSQFEVFYQQELQGCVNWSLTGRHNTSNALAAIAAAHHIGIHPAQAIAALAEFKSVKRRMEIIAKSPNLTIYDDFAHHPTAIATTLAGLREQVGNERIIAVVEPRSNTMRLGVHRDTLADSLGHADLAILFQAEQLGWDLSAVQKQGSAIDVYQTLDELVARLHDEMAQGGHIVLMSNGSFGGIYQRLQNMLA